jgi:hypothetical protein
MALKLVKFGCRSNAWVQQEQLGFGVGGLVAEDCC